MAMNRQQLVSKMIELKPQLYAYAFKLTKNTANAKDLVQDVYLKALLHLDEFNGTEDKLRMWLFTILYNTFINSYRRIQKIKDVLFTLEDLTPLKSMSSLQNPESVLAEKEIIKSINQLTSIQNKEAFQLYIQGFKYKEIAVKQKVPVGTVKTRVFHARKELIKLYSNDKSSESN
jgi:RNA polymerase sigma-70 factor (ECF subfamily)